MGCTGGNSVPTNETVRKEKLENEETKKEVGMVIESIDNIEVAHDLAQNYNVEMPIVNTVYDVIHNGLNPKEAVSTLMTRQAKRED